MNDLQQTVIRTLQPYNHAAIQRTGIGSANNQQIRLISRSYMDIQVFGPRSLFSNHVYILHLNPGLHAMYRPGLSV